MFLSVNFKSSPDLNHEWSLVLTIELFSGLTLFTTLRSLRASFHLLWTRPFSSSRNDVSTLGPLLIICDVFSLEKHNTSPKSRIVQSWLMILHLHPPKRPLDLGQVYKTL